LASTAAGGSTPGAPNSVGYDTDLAGDGLTLTALPDLVTGVIGLTFTLPADRAFVNLRVFDSLGHSVRWLIRGEEGGHRREVEWDATGDSGQHLTAGIYIVLLAARTPDGRSYRAKRVVVVGKGLR